MTEGTKRPEKGFKGSRIQVKGVEVKNLKPYFGTKGGVRLWAMNSSWSS